MRHQFRLSGVARLYDALYPNGERIGLRRSGYFTRTAVRLPVLKCQRTIVSVFMLSELNSASSVLIVSEGLSARMILPITAMPAAPATLTAATLLAVMPPSATTGTPVRTAC